MGGSGKKVKVPKPKEMDYAKEGEKYLTAMGPLIGQTLDLERQYRPEFTKLNLAEVGQYTAGLQDIQSQATRAAQEQLTSAQGANIASMTGLSGAARGLMQAYSPEQAMMVQQATEAANQAYGRTGTLSPDQMRESTQQARESAASAGRIGGNADIAAQILNREQMLGARRAEAAQAGQQAFGLGQSMYQQPLMALLGSTPQAYGAGQQFSEYGMGMLGKSSPQLVNPDTGINLAAAYRKDLLGAQAAQAQASAAQSAGKSSMIGSVAGAVGIGAVLI